MRSIQISSDLLRLNLLVVVATSFLDFIVSVAKYKDMFSFMVWTIIMGLINKKILGNLSLPELGLVADP